MTFSLPFTRANRMRALTFGVLALGVLSVQVGRGTLAFFTTSVGSTANTFTTGDLHFNIADNNQSAVTSVTSSIALSNMKPGDTVYAPLIVSNIGSLDGQYGISYTAAVGSGVDLTPALLIGIVGAGSGGGVATTCDSAHFTTGTWAEQIFPTASTLQATQIFVDSTSGTHPSTPGAFALPGDVAASIPILHATGSDVLCVQVTFPYGSRPGTLVTGDDVYNTGSANTTIVFTLNGEQLTRSAEFAQPTGGTSGNF